MTRSVLDDLPGVGPARKRSILQHFGSPERFLSASREELESVPGLPQKVARDIHAYGQQDPMIQDFVVITGFSGAGKSQAMATLRTPATSASTTSRPMISSLADLFGHEGSKVEHAAVASDTRGAATSRAS